VRATNTTRSRGGGDLHTAYNTNTTQHNTTQHNTTTTNATTQPQQTQHNATQRNTTQHNTTQHNTTQHNTTQTQPRNKTVVNGDACRNNGAWYGPTAARNACDTARRYCSGGRTASGPLRSSIGPTNLAQVCCDGWNLGGEAAPLFFLHFPTHPLNPFPNRIHSLLPQCANIAFGACQQRANDAYSWGNPCRDALRSGYAQCSAQQFRQFYEGETRDLCYNNAKSVSGVNPGTNQCAFACFWVPFILCA
jgi:hypothetical protein